MLHFLIPAMYTHLLYLLFVWQLRKGCLVCPYMVNELHQDVVYV